MSLTGEEITAPYRKWLENEVSSLTSLRTDLGKFFFGVSSGTVGLLVGLDKIGLKLAPDATIVFSLAAFFASMVVALLMVKPPIWSLSSQTDLFDEHSCQVGRLVQFTWGWFALWVVAVGPWLYRLYRAAPNA